MPGQDAAARKSYDAPQEEYTRAPLLFPPFATIMMFLLFGGVFSAMALLSLNWWSLRKYRKALFTPLTIMVTWILLHLTVLLLYFRADADIIFRWDSAATISMVIGFCTGLAVVIWQLRAQHPYYQPVVDRYGLALRDSCLAYIFLMVVIFGGVVAGSEWSGVFRSLINSINPALTALSPQTTYTSQNFSISYPAHWLRTDAFEKPCSRRDFECHLALVEPVGITLFYLTEYKNVQQNIPVRDMSESLIAYDENRLDGFRRVDGRVRDVDGHQGYIMRYSYDGPDTNNSVVTLLPNRQRMQGVWWIIRDGKNLLSVKIAYVDTLSATVDAILDSLHFTSPAGSD